MRTPQIRFAQLSGALSGYFAPNDLLAGSFVEHGLVSDVPGRAGHLDPNLANPLGIGLLPTSPFWVAHNHTGKSTFYDGTGLSQSLVVSIPPPAGGTPLATPTGTVFNGGAGFEVAPGSPAFFLCTEALRNYFPTKHVDCGVRGCN